MTTRDVLRGSKRRAVLLGTPRPSREARDRVQLSSRVEPRGRSLSSFTSARLLHARLVSSLAPSASARRAPPTRPDHGRHALPLASRGPRAAVLLLSPRPLPAAAARAISPHDYTDPLIAPPHRAASCALTPRKGTSRIGPLPSRLVGARCPVGQPPPLPAEKQRTPARLSRVVDGGQRRQTSVASKRVCRSDTRAVGQPAERAKDLRV